MKNIENLFNNSAQKNTNQENNLTEIQKKNDEYEIMISKLIRKQKQKQNELESAQTLNKQYLEEIQSQKKEI